MSTQEPGSSGFGRRHTPAVLPSPVAVPALEIRPAASKPAIDPELVAWKKGRAGKRRLTWITAGLVVLGGPMSLLLPGGIGELAGLGLMALGAMTLLARLRPNPDQDT
jgi:hypothetical protein